MPEDIGVLAAFGGGSPALGDLPPHTTLWRYMDFSKFVSMLQSRSLYFCHLQHHRTEDPYEGTPTKLQAQWWQSKYQALLPNVPLVETWLNPAATTDVFVNCWHINRYESAAMWRLYVESHEGIAIKTTLANLLASIDSQRCIYNGPIKYVDYSEDRFFLDEQRAPPCFFKRKSFVHENEFRLACNDGIETIAEEGKLASMYRNYPNMVFTTFAPPSRAGVKLAVSLEKLVNANAVHVSPTSPSWEKDVIEGVSQAYGLRCPVIQSDLRSSPIW